MRRRLQILSFRLAICLAAGVLSTAGRHPNPVISDEFSGEIAETETIPQGAASLAFVFDITGSMYDDLVQVIEGAAKILATTLARREKPLYNYILVPFHDPEVGPVTVTTDPDKFQRDLRDLYVQGGGDCPEMSITAIKIALQESLPNSFIYVFTDARSKDYSLTEQVLTLIQHKQSQVVFVMTGDCGDTSHPGYKAYEQIAATSSGQIFLLKKSQVNQVLNFVRVAVQSRKVNLVSMDRSYKDDVLVYELPVDSKLQEFTISVSGERAKVVIRDPDGNIMTSKNGLNTLLSLRNALILNVKDPKPGKWVLRVSAEGQHTIRVTGLSSLDFEHGFSTRATLHFSETETRPMKGTPTYLLINATDLDFPGRINKLELVNLHGNVLLEVPIHYYGNRPSLYNVSSFIPPLDFFYVKVVGIDNQGFDFQRTTPTAISPIDPELPSVQMAKDTRGFYDEVAVLTCSVSSLVPFAVQWYRNGDPVGNKLFYSESSDATWSIPDASSSSEGHYTCNATNAAGWASATTYLDVTDPPPTIVKPLDVYVMPSHNATLTCVAHSTVEFNMTWFRHESNGSLDTPLGGSRTELLSNGSAMIKNVKRNDEGLYVCRASNEGGHTDEIVQLVVHKEPRVTVVPPAQTFIVGSRVDLQCTAVAYPKPVFTWRRAGRRVEISDRVSYDTEGHLIINEAVHEDVGDWECVATNPLGVGTAVAILDYIELPSVRAQNRVVLVNSGDTAQLVCEAHGVPKPNVTWYRGGIELQELSFIQIAPSGQLTILGTQEVDSGEYECVAMNEAGSASEIVILEVGSAPVITKQPQNKGVDILKNITLPCSAVGKPLPKISWSRTDGKQINFESGRVRTLDTGALFIQGVQKEDEGMYMCTVSNQFGKQEASAFIAVTGIVKPLIAYITPNLETIEGRDVKLTCTVLLGNPTPKIMWFKMGERVKSNDKVIDDGNGNLYLKKVRVEEEGEYMCVASNPGGNATHIIKLDVQVPPSINDSATDITVTQGNSVRLPCEVNGDPKPQITWTKNGIRISEVDPHYFVSESGNLEIFNADPEDAATYSCTAMNVAGVKEKRITLFVQTIPIISDGQDDFTVIVNNPIHLSCDVTGNPPPSIVWKKGLDDVEPDENGNVVFLPNGALRINHVRVEDGGMYECIATSVAGSASKVVHLNVQVPPKFESRAPKTIVALVGEEVVLPCEVIGDPRPEIEWRKDLNRIDFFSFEHKYFLRDSGSLVIPQVAIADAARYLCVAENPAGVVTQEINLVVHEPPQIPEDTETEIEIVEDNRVTLPCPARGTPTPKVRWFKDNVPLTGNEIGVRVLHDGSLQLDHAQEENAGNYHCFAENIAGNATHYITLSVYLPPRFDGDDTDNVETNQVVQNNTIRLFCPARAIPPPQITWYKNGEELFEEELDGRIRITNDGMELEISAADVYDAARYTCIARNLAGEMEKMFDLEVYVKPRIGDGTLLQFNISVIADRPIVIDCLASGTPQPTITWYKDEREITADTSPGIRILANGQRLEINSADTSDTGRYRCLAVNPAGSTDKEHYLNVWIPAKIDTSDKISNPEVIVNRTITLHCPASGVPLPDVSWYRDDDPVREDVHNVRILDKGWRLQIKSAEVAHTARYTCRAKNIAGDSEKHYDLNVLVVPSIDRSDILLSPKVIVNRTVIINCPASGTPSPDIVWTKNNEILDPILHPNVELMASGRQLRISSAAVSDAGTYQCIVSNKAGKDSQDFQLSVLIPSSIDRSRLDYYPTVVVNQSKTLDCPVIGIPQPKITWSKDGESISFQHQPHLRLQQEGRRLEILAALAADAGTYECRAENEAGTDHISYNLKVFVPPSIDITLSSPSNPQVVVDQSYTISCVVNGISTPKIQWLTAGQPLDESNPRYRLANDGRQLQILRSEVADTGRYTCIAKNEAGISERDFDLDVLVPPYIDDTNLDLQPKVIKGKTVTLRCPVQGIPFPNVTWFKGNDPIVETGRIRFLLTGRQMEISVAEETDTARYSCVAVNSVGKATKEFDLSVLVPPAIDEANLVDSPKIIVNRTVLLECPVAGVPPPKVKWMKNNEPFVPGHGIQLLSNGRHLEISRAKVSDTARYTCVATNEAGELRRNFDLDVLVPAHIDGEGKVENIEVIENHTTYMNCPADGIPPPSILWLKDNVPLLDFPYVNLRELDSGKRLEMRNVQLVDEGVYKCQATNVAGQKTKSFKLKVLVPPRIPGSRTDTDLAVIVRRPVKIECEPTGVPEPEITWFKNGKVINVEENLYVRLLRAGRVLQIVSADVGDAGLYTCNAQNVAGQEQRRYRLQVQVPPAINNSHIIEELSIVVGSTIDMDCPASGTPEPSVRWLRDGENFTYISHPNLRTTEKGSLQVANAQLPDIGSYTCVASNVAGNTTKDFLLSVLVPPSIEDGATEVAATVGTRAILMCDTLGLPKPEVTWEKNDKIIPSSGSHYMMHRTGSLQFSSVQVEDGGSYRCVAKNSAGTVYRDIKLIVQVPPKIEQQGPVQLKVVLGSTVDLPCKATGIPKPKITWQKGTRILTDVPGYKHLDDGSLKIEAVDMKDAGIYICVVQNNAGTALGQVRLEVQVPPSIEPPQAEYRVVQDRELVLPCRANGLPSPRIRWEKDGQLIPQDDLRYRTLRSGWLAISIARVEDAGEYTCVAENDAGNASVSMQLVVSVPPSIAEADRVLTVNEGEEARLPCVAIGHPPPVISWIQDGRSMLTTGGRYNIQESGTLVINLIQSTDAGSYVCTAKNSAGRDSKEVVLKVQVPPTFVLIPRDQEVMANGRIELECVAEGIPTPIISWKINNTDFMAVRQILRKNRMYKVTRSVNGRSKLVIDDALKRDDGTYMCVAENAAGSRRALAAVRVKVPPKVLIQSGREAFSITERALLNCPVDGGDPPPMIIWMKNDLPVEINERIQQLPNGSLAIDDSSNDDAGEYKCVATNDAGSSEGIAYLTIRTPPTFKIEPRTMTVDRGHLVVLDCVAEGEPMPQMTWRKERKTLQTEDRITILSNNSLRIIASQLVDSGIYICMARNSLGSILISANLTVQVHGHYSTWSSWSPCSVSCGDGSSGRTRSCDNPEPANGGRPCSGVPRETKYCTPMNCPIDGGWTEWSEWEHCSQSCGSGFKSRSRDCINPTPQFGGRKCAGDALERVKCNVRPCPVDGGWGDWSLWRPCSETCGEGVQDRYRRCDNPRTENGGRECVGLETDRRSCKETECEINGNWGAWTDWSSCTLSCGGGTRTRRRKCDSPPPSTDGRFCPGSDHQIDYCNKEDCPVHGGWGDWSSWGDCTVTCGGGQRRRFRTCSNPTPLFNGRPCIGSGQATDVCNPQRCAVDGEWSLWGDWTECSKTCDGGMQERYRTCRQPQFGGTGCPGDGTHMRKCNIQPCKANMPHNAVASVIGNINNKEFGIAKIYANISRMSSGTRISGIFTDVPGQIGRHLQPLISILTPIYWTTATEVGEAVNGYTLTQGNFEREVQVEFATGEVLTMTHSAKGVDIDGVLNIDVVINGRVPVLPERAHIIVLPYTEDYIQTGPGSIYAHSSRVFRVDGHTLPYSWNHQISYDSDYGKMPYLVERLSADDVSIDFDVSREVLQYQLTASIAKGEPSNQCPSGFFLHPEGPYCKDDDECTRLSPCSHVCSNSMGSFTCGCPTGYMLDSTGRTCIDIDECENGISNCLPNNECINTRGSYRCAPVCEEGFVRSSATQNCEDINECRDSSNVCGEHECVNMIGSFMCSCRAGYRRTASNGCEDIDECESEEHKCSHGCMNMLGSYRCSCPAGFKLTTRFGCTDIDECADESHDCYSGQNCQNSLGGFTCVDACPNGFTETSNGSCVDIDECETRSNECKFNQACVNSPGGYSCACPRGFRSAGVNRPCVDIDECQKQSRCQHGCQNTPGSFRCTCPPGYKLSANRRTCQDVDECVEQKVVCGPNQRCFNKRGDFECIDITCPPEYERDTATGYCVLRCNRNQGVDCPPGAHYRDILEFHMVALPSGIPANRDLIRLLAYDQENVHLPQTTFSIIENDHTIPFAIRLEDGKGVVYTLKPLQEKQLYQMKVEARSFDHRRKGVQYHTTFMIYISVSSYPY